MCGEESSAGSSRDGSVANRLCQDRPGRSHQLDTVEEALLVAVRGEFRQQFGFYLALGVEDGLRLLCETFVTEWVALELDSFTDCTVIVWPHELDLGMVCVAGAEDHALGEHLGEVLRFHVREDNDFVREHIFEGDKLLQTRHNRTNLAIRLSQVNLLNVEFL